ncbi:MAG: M1 family peptidase, partial [bacterium]
HEKNALYINLPRSFAKNTTATFIINYRGIPADGLRIGNTKHGERSFFNENWPNRTRHWLPTVDHPYDKATNEFVIIAPSHYQVISNGLLVEESILNANQKLTHWKQSVPISSWLYVLGVARFAVQYVDEFMGKQIQTWVYPQDREKGFFDFASPTKEVLGFYSNYVGPFAYEKLANIQTPSVGG